jgi:foldase protein PrsA
MAGAGNSPARGSRRAIVLAALTVLVIVAVTSGLIYGNRRAPFNTGILSVNDTTIKMRYFLKRLSWSRGDAAAMLQTLTNEEIIKQTTPHPPYNMSITADEVDLFLKEIARKNGGTKNEGDFKSWYRTQLEETRLTDAEYRDILLTSMLSQRLTFYLKERVPTVSEQVHLYMIVQASVEEALRVKERIDSGEDFFALARLLNTDESLKAQGGDLGWFPRGALSADTARTAFDELGVGQVSEPLVSDDSFAALVFVSERAAARQIEDETLQMLQSKALETWLKQEKQHHRVVIRGLENGYDAETDAWVQWQLSRMKQ